MTTPKIPTCFSLLKMLLQTTINWAAYKQKQKCIYHHMEAGNIGSGCPHGQVLYLTKDYFLVHRCPSFHCVLNMVAGAKKLSQASFIWYESHI